MFRARLQQCMLLSGLLMSAGFINAEEVVEEVVVIGVLDETESAFEELHRYRFSLPDATSIINLDALMSEVKNSMADVLRQAPGVFVSPLSPGNDAHISIRGSGITGEDGGRGVKIYQDGILLNLPGGPAPMGLMDYQSAKSLELQRGNQANVLGAGVSGGVINIRSRTGQDLQGARLRLEAGSFSHQRLFIESGFIQEGNDFYASASHFQSDGQREQEERDQQQLNISFGSVINEQWFSRTQLLYMHSDAENPGPVHRVEWEDDPYAVDQESIDLDYTRAMEGFRLSEKLRYTPDEHILLELPVSITKNNFTGMPNAREGLANDWQEGVVFTPSVQYFHEEGQLANWFSLGIHAGYSEESIRHYAFDELTLERTIKAISFDQTIRDWDWFIQNRVAFNEQWQLSTSIQKNYFIRKSDDNITCEMCVQPVEGEYSQPRLASGDQSYQLSESRLDYLLGLSYFPNPFHHVFVSFYTSSSFVNGRELGMVQQFSDVSTLDIQVSKTWELGYKLDTESVRGEVILYSTAIDNELLSTRLVPPGPPPPGPLPIIVTNVGETVHQGIEIKLAAVLMPDTLLANLVYSYNDFHFDDHPEYGNNALPASPAHVLNVSFDIMPMEGLKITPVMRYISGRFTTYDHSGQSLYRIPSYRVYDLKVSYEEGAWQTFLEIENILDEDYIAESRGMVTMFPGEPNEGPKVMTGQGQTAIVGFSYEF